MPSRYYWDACVILEYLNARADRAPQVNALMDSASKHEVEIFTSTLSVTEVAYAAQDKAQGSLSEESEQKIEYLWESKSPIRRMEFHIVIAEAARSLIQTAMQQGIGGVRSIDMMHLATAQIMQVDEFHTYEDEPRREKWTAISGLTVCEPHSDTPQLNLGGT